MAGPSKDKVTTPRRTFLRALAAAGAGALTSTAAFPAERARVIDVHSHFWASEYLDSLIADDTAPGLFVQDHGDMPAVEDLGQGFEGVASSLSRWLRQAAGVDVVAKKVNG